MKNFFPSLLLVLAFAVAFPVTAWASSPATNSVYEQSLYTGWSYNANNNSFSNNGGANVSYNKTFLDLLLNNFKGINYQLSGSSGPNTSGISLYTLINNLYFSLTSTSNGTILSYMSSDSQKLSQINTTLGNGTSLKNVMTNLDALVSWTSSSNHILSNISSNGLQVNLPFSLIDSVSSIDSNNTIISNSLTDSLVYSSNFIRDFQTSNSFRNFLTTPNTPFNSVSAQAVQFSTRIGSNASIYRAYPVNPSSVLSHLSYNTNALSTLQQMIFTPSTYYYGYKPSNNGLTGSGDMFVALSVGDYLSAINYQLSTSLNALTYVLADSDTVSAKNNNQPLQDAFLNNFTGSGLAAASASDFSNMASAANDFSSGLSGGASYDNTFNFMNGDSDAWDWFTQEAADDLDNVQARNTRRLLRSTSDTPLLDAYFNSVLGFLGGGS